MIIGEVNEMLKRIKMKLSEKKGNISIISTILILIGMTILFTMYDYTNRTWVLQEVRGIMDSAGLTTLTEVVDKDFLKDEVFSVQTGQGGNLTIDTTDWTEKTYRLSTQVRNKIHTAYEQKLNAQIVPGGMIKGVDVLHLDSYVKFDEWGTGYNTSGKSRAYLVLGSVVAVDVATSQTYETPLKLSSGVFQNFRNGTTFEVQGVESLDNNTMRIIARSVVRVVYR